MTALSNIETPLSLILEGNASRPSVLRSDIEALLATHGVNCPVGVVIFPGYAPGLSFSDGVFISRSATIPFVAGRLSPCVVPLAFFVTAMLMTIQFRSPSGFPLFPRIATCHHAFAIGVTVILMTGVCPFHWVSLAVAIGTSIVICTVTEEAEAALNCGLCLRLLGSALIGAGWSFSLLQPFALIGFFSPFWSQLLAPASASRASIALTARIAATYASAIYSLTDARVISHCCALVLAANLVVQVIVIGWRYRACARRSVEEFMRDSGYRWSDPSTNDCLICYQGLSAGVVVMPCGHAIHMECLAQWLRHGEVCPYCRHPLSVPTSDQIDAMMAVAQPLRAVVLCDRTESFF
jgi:hypothetical protein